MRAKASVLLRLEEALLGLLILAVTFVIFFNVLFRYLGGFSLSWAEEFARYATIWITFIGSSVCIWYGQHVTVDVLEPILSKRWNSNLETLVSLLSALGCGYLAYLSWGLVSKTIATGQRAIALGIPMWAVYGALPLGFALMAWRFLGCGLRTRQSKQET